MKFYLTLALIALLLNVGSTARPHLRPVAAEDVVVQELTGETDLDNVDVDNSVVNDESVSNAVNLLDSNVPVTLVENPPTKTLTRHVNQPVQSVGLQNVPVQNVGLQNVPVQNVGVQNVPVQSVPVQSVNVQTVGLQNVPVQSVGVQNLPVESVPVQSLNVRTVGVQNVPDQSVVLQNVPVQSVNVQTVPLQSVGVQNVQSGVKTLQRKSVVHTTVPQKSVVTTPQQVVYQVPQLSWNSVVGSVKSPQQVVYSQVQQTLPQQQYVLQTVPQQQQYVRDVAQQVAYTQVQQTLPQQQYVLQNVPQQYLSSVVQQPQLSVVQQPQLSVVQQPQLSVPQQQLVVRRSEPTVSKSVYQLVKQPVQPVQVVSKTVHAKVPNPLVLRLTPARTVGQSALTGSQLTDVADESSKDVVLSQETESY